MVICHGYVNVDQRLWHCNGVTSFVAMENPQCRHEPRHLVRELDWMGYCLPYLASAGQVSSTWYSHGILSPVVTGTLTAERLVKTLTWSKLWTLDESFHQIYETSIYLQYLLIYLSTNLFTLVIDYLPTYLDHIAKWWNDVTCTWLYISVAMSIWRAFLQKKQCSMTKISRYGQRPPREEVSFSQSSSMSSSSPVFLGFAKIHGPFAKVYGNTMGM